MRTSPSSIVPYQPQLPPMGQQPRKVSRVINAYGRFGALGAAAATIPVGAGTGAGAAIGASQGASIGSAVVPGIGTAIGAIVGAIGGAIAGSVNKVDPENYNFNQMVALYGAGGANAVYAIQNKYLALAGLFDLNIQTNIPIYKKFGHMGEQAFTNWLANTIYAAGQNGTLTAQDTPLTVMSRVVQPAINAWSYGAMSDPNAGAINALIVGMVLDYVDGNWVNWKAVGGDFPFGNLPAFELANTGSTPTVAAVTQSGAAVAPSSAYPAPPQTGSSANGATITPTSGTYLQTSAGLWYFGPQTTNGGNVLYLYTNSPQWVGAGGVQAVIAGSTLYLQNNVGSWFYWNGSGWAASSAPNIGASQSPSTTVVATQPAPTSPQQPPAPTVIDSTDGSQITAPGTALETSAGTLIYLGAQAANDPNNKYGYPIWENGQHNGYAVGLLMLNGGQIYAVNSVPTWYQWTANNWVQLAAAPTAKTPVTTSTTPASAASSTVSTTATPVTATSATSSNAVVATTASGSTVTSADIQDLVNQMAAQSASQEQAYSSIISELQEQGASITSGVQNQVAAQVSSTIPASSATTSASSNTGLYIVGGGLALLALFAFMRKRA